jgi:hypothetical protein
VSKKLRYSRWRRLPAGLSRITERKIPGPDADLQRLTLYVPGRLLDAAEALAQKAGAPSVQAYCEDLLRTAIENEQTRHKLTDFQERTGGLDSLDEIANDPDYLAEWTASIGSGSRDEIPRALESPPPSTPSPEEPALPGPSDATEVVLRHAGRLGDDAGGLLPVLRRGERPDPDSARELMQALIDLERTFQGEGALDRRLAFALHRLAFESQILITDAWPGLAADPAVVDTVRLVQEAVDRVLSGEDIRYGAS